MSNILNYFIKQNKHSTLISTSHSHPFSYVVSKLHLLLPEIMLKENWKTTIVCYMDSSECRNLNIFSYHSLLQKQISKTPILCREKTAWLSRDWTTKNINFYNLTTQLPTNFIDCLIGIKDSQDADLNHQLAIYHKPWIYLQFLKKKKKGENLKIHKHMNTIWLNMMKL